MIVLLAAFAGLAILLVPIARWLGPRVFFLAAALPLGAFIHALLQTGRVLEGNIPLEEYEWIAPLGVSISMRMDTLSWVMTLLVTGVGALVLLYCRDYFRGTKNGLGRFAAVLLAFAGAMYGLVLTDDIIMLVIFWEITSVLSYLLIGHYFTRAASRRAALQSLLTTTLGGLVMFVGAVILAVVAQTNSIQVILQEAPNGMLVDVALVCLLIGAMSKSALFPFHFWLPGAMAAPTPVSAYLHAAAMVKAGIYLLARFAPAFGEADPWRPILVSFGIFTMLLGGYQALRERDLKRVLAYGTVSQLGFLSVVIGYGTQDTALAGIAMLVAHSLFKATLFLVVGIIDRQLGTRDVDKLNGLGKQAPTLAAISIIAIASMAGLPPFLGFVGKEAALASLLDAALDGSGWGWIALVGVVVGSMLTFAYGVRFVWGAFWTKRDSAGVLREKTVWPDPPIGFLVSPLILTVLTVIGGIAAPVLDRLFAPYAESVPGEGGYHLALWHGLEPALGLSVLAAAGGVGVFWLSIATGWDRTGRLLRYHANDVYYGVTRLVDRLAVFVTWATHWGSLPIYVGTVFVVLIASQGTVLLSSAEWRVELEAWHHPAQPVTAILMIAAAVVAVRARKRFTGVILVSVTGLGMVVFFALSGAPDLAVTQVLVETVTLVAFALVLRRIPSRMGDPGPVAHRILRGVIGAGVGLTMAAVAIIAASARTHRPVSDEWEELAYTIGHGRNIVNVALVDLRGWDTMGELSVLVVAATGVASLVFVTARGDRLSQIRRVVRAKTSRAVWRAARHQPLVETTGGIEVQTSENRDRPRAWLAGGARMDAPSRALVLEVVVRILFHTIIVISLYLVFAGHNLPGGGFAGGLVAGLALVMRYVAGGRWELGLAAPTDAGRLLGAGMAIAVGTAIAPMVFGLDPLTRAVWEADLPLVGHVHFVTSTFFDIGVYLVVIGLVLDVLRSLGAEVDRQIDDDGGRTFTAVTAPEPNGSEGRS
ncbi:Na+/H+ antiporter subunit A [Microbacterium amylolyticum]|uniref:Multicomponent Na+:H+ antiporter subunit A n=1 Tax=Microbacterium amylolyticum TaxID=936337 RepID=A0ABS4ZIN5_9MICO|nr:Na+/H+ antiporter subunit A [Microbacterium amylolyticum]MBP2436883.1 multicomponent Na+:H+ antiporter subunit A [Microbacterium amylolyticum]